MGQDTQLSTPKRIQLELQRHGLRKTLYKLWYKVANKLVLLRVLQCIVIDQIDPAFLKCPDGYTAQFLPREMQLQFCDDPQNGLPRDFVERATLKRDECLGLCDANGHLAAYGWYASTPTPIDPPDLWLTFSPDYVYMYNGFTQAGHRGKRLHGVGMTSALQHYLSSGRKGLVSYIEANNFDSLKSSLRMGYTVVGSIYVLKIFGHYFIRASRGCEKYGFGLQYRRSA